MTEMELHVNGKDIGKLGIVQQGVRSRSRSDPD